MKHDKPQHFIAIFFLVTIFCVGIFSITVNHSAITNTTLNPLTSTQREGKTPIELVGRVIQSFETAINENILFRKQLIDVYGFVQKQLGNSVMIDPVESKTVVLDSDNNLQFTFQQVNTKPLAQSLASLSEEVRAMGSELYFIQAPSKISETKTVLPAGIVDYGNANANSLLQQLDELGVLHIDLRTLVEPLTDGFYRTDHHWKSETAYYAYLYVLETLMSQHSIGVRPSLDPADYETISCDACFLGSQGKRVGAAYTQLDDYSLIYPTNFDSYEVSINNGKRVRTLEGSFYDTIVKEKFLDFTLPVDTNRYASYFGGDHPEVIIKNNDVDTGKILVIQDSFGLPFSAFLSQSVNELRMLDLRHYKEQSLRDYIQDYNPDMVLFLYYPSAFHNATMFDFGY